MSAPTSETLIPSLRLRWREVFRVNDGQIAISVPSWPECSPSRYVLEQAFRRPGTDEDLWIEVEVGND